MNIESGNNNGCVRRAFSTMRLCLGLDGKLPVEITDTEIEGIISVVGSVFPDNEIKVWALKENFEKSTPSKNVEYCGDEFVTAETDDTKYIMCFSYHPREKSTGHMVVGWPEAFNNFLGIIIAVKENDEKETQKEYE